jgi:hypothetical protein
LTSLSTVGLGDYYPINDEERLVGGFLLLSGGAVFATMSGLLIDAIMHLNKFDQEFDDGDELNKFFDTLKRNFNGGVDIKLKLRLEITEFLDDRWKNNKTNFLVNEEDQMLMSQLP